MKYKKLFIFLIIKSVLCKVIFEEKSIGEVYMMDDLSAEFGPDIPKNGLKGNIVISNPIDGCTKPTFKDFKSNWFLLMERGMCDFDVKVRNAQSVGAIAALVFNNDPNDNLIKMWEKHTQDIIIPSVFIDYNAGELIKYYNNSETNIALLYNSLPFFYINYKFIIIVTFSILGLFGIVSCFTRSSRFRNSTTAERISRMTRRQIKKLKKITYTNENSEEYQTCAICLEDYIINDKLRILPCDHEFHTTCIDKWLLKNSSKCPKCRHGAIDRSKIPLIENGIQSVNDVESGESLLPYNEITTNNV